MTSTVSISRELRESLERWFFREKETDVRIRLTVWLEEDGLSLRDFGAFLAFADSVYGRCSELGLHSYAHRTGEHVRFTRVKPGSLELIIEYLKSELVNPSALILLYLLLKYLPNLSVSVKHLTGAARDVEEVRTLRKSREELSRLVRREPGFDELPSREKAELTELLDALLRAERDQYTATRRFLREYLRETTLESEEVE